MFSPLFYLFALIMIVGGLMVVFMRNPVSSALSMVLSFVGLAGIFVGLNAYFVGVLQILVYAGAIMVLFIFIIMLLDIKEEEKNPRKGAALAAGIFIPAIILFQLVGVLCTNMDSPQAPELTLKEAASQYDESSIIHKRLADNRLPDVHLIGRKLYTEYNFPLQVIAVLLLVATVGCVSLSKKQTPIAAQKTPNQKPTSTPTVKTAPAVEQSPETKPEVETTEKPIAETTPKLPEGASIDEKRGLIYTSRPADADDLKEISGVGPVLENKLNDFGVYTFRQIAEWSEPNVAEFDTLLTFKGRIQRDNWLTQAAELHSQKNT